MKQQITRFSPHQNGKVFGVLMAVTSSVVLLPFMLLASAFAPPEQKFPMWLVLIFPVMYLVMGYVMTAIGCAVYNLLFKAVGGIEFDTDHPPAP